MIIEWEGWNCGDHSSGNLQSKVRKSGPEWKSKLIPILASQSVRGGGEEEDNRVMMRERWPHGRMISTMLSYFCI